MKCAMKGCKNEVLRSQGRPRKYCSQKCARKRVNEMQLAAYHKQPKPKAPPFVCAGCGLTITPTDKRPRKYCSSLACQTIRAGRNSDAQAARQIKAPRVAKREKKGQVYTRRGYNTDRSVDREARWRNFDRGTPEGMQRYLEANPVYREFVFPGA